ncbi:MAG: hypothetical protein D6818_00630 [Bacteroidetes bacterium]|nr:MAG: hypothetical protein D6818_00630 [Bacteroidota bacterium]
MGKYVVEGVQPLEISRKGNRLYASLPGQPTYTLAPRDAWWFDLAELNGFSMKFVLDENGKVKEVIIYQPNGTFRAQPKK